MPIWLTDNMFRTIRYFDKFIGQQAHEPVYVLFRKWFGPMVTGTASGFRLNSIYQRYEFTLYTPTIPVTDTGKPFLRSLRVFLDGTEMTPVYQYDQTTSNLDFWMEIDKGGPRDRNSYGTLIVGFHEGFNPTGHIIEYRYEEVCHCIDVGEESFHPDSRCSTCYGTGFVGGYNQYLSLAVREANRVVKPTNTILCRFPITSEILKISRYGGEIVTRRKSWTVASPLLHDWDMIIRMRAYGAPMHIDPVTQQVPNERYWITEWEHSSARPSYDLPLRAQPGMNTVSRGITLHQKFSTVEVQPEHIAYQIPFTAG
ncbi:unnamed protein product [marine sediment metagenome]|uniref:Uncharacterized protein n=1 Tax=marine sediment metagenome TaxID=412755 RepID=X0S0I4_9ZZZZ